jgi:hypothetical protein
MANTKKKALLAGAVLSAVILTSAASCDNKYTEPFKDAPRSGNDNMDPMNVVDMGDGFSNVGWKCIGKDGVYAAFHGDHTYAAISVVANDPNCVPGAAVK